MNRNTSTILTGGFCLLVLAAVILGVCYALGIFNTKKILPITYPDSSIQWVTTNDGAIRATFDKKLNISDKAECVKIDAEVNGVYDERNGQTFDLIKVDSKVLPYTVFSGTRSITDNSSEASVEYEVSFKIYNGATLTSTGEVQEGKGFVFELTSFKKMNSVSSQFENTKLESMHIYSIWEDTQNTLA